MLKYIIFLMIASGLSLYAQNEDPFDSESAEEVEKIDAELQKKLDQETQAEIDRQVAMYITPLNVAGKLGIDFPPAEPERNIEDLQKEVNDNITTAVNKKFPLSKRDEEVEAAAKRYPLYKEGDYVEVKIRPAGRNNIAKGKFNGYDRKKQLVIGSYSVPKVDMTENVMVFFDPELNKKKRETLVKNKLHYFYLDREKMSKELRPKLEEDIFAAAGYYLNDDGKYTSASSYVKSVYERYKKKAQNIIKEHASRLVLARHDYSMKNGKVKKDYSINKTEVANEVAEKVNELIAQVLGGTVEKKKPLFDPAFYSTDF